MPRFKRTEPRCQNCRMLESWHSDIDNACPDDSYPHPDAEAPSVTDAAELDAHDSLPVNHYFYYAEVASILAPVFNAAQDFCNSLSMLAAHSDACFLTASIPNYRGTRYDGD